MGAALVNALVRKNNAVEWPKMWMICHPDARVLEVITTTINQGQAAGEGRPDQGAAAGPVMTDTRAEIREEPCPGWSVLRRT